MRRLLWLITGVVIGLGGAGATFLALQPTGTGAAATPPTAQRPATAPVERQTLESTEELDGALGYAGEATLSNGLTGTVTALPEEGATLDRGDAIVEVDGGRSSILMYGDRPAWRTLAEGVDRGEDVRQLEENLQALGYTGDGFEPDRRFGHGTTRAVKRWEKALGVERDGVVELGDVVFSPGPVRITDLQVGLGDRAQPGQVVASVSSTERVVVVALDADRQDIIAAGDTVAIELPDGTVTTGRVDEIGSVATAPETGGPAQVEVTISLDEPDATGTLDGAPVTVSVTRERREDVLTVPVDALLALREGGYAVEVVDEAGTTRLVAVELGLFQDGFVEVEGEIRESDDVVVPR